MTIATRPGTSDSMVVDSIILEDEYRLASRRFSGWAIDVGAHIGVAAYMLLERNPDLQVVAVEPVPENADMARENLSRFGDRAHVEQAAVGSEHGSRITVWHTYTHVKGWPDDYVSTNRYIGGLWREEHGAGTGTEVPVVSLAGLIDKYQMDSVALIKTDCEGAEYAFFSDPEANARVEMIVGEWHDSEPNGKRIREALEPTHEFTRFEPENEGITGLFTAVRR